MFLSKLRNPAATSCASLPAPTTASPAAGYTTPWAPSWQDLSFPHCAPCRDPLLSEQYTSSPCGYTLCYTPTPPKTLLHKAAHHTITYKRNNAVPVIALPLNRCIQLLLCACHLSLHLTSCSANPYNMHITTIPSTNPTTTLSRTLLPLLSASSHNFHHFASLSLNQYTTPCNTRNNCDTPGHNRTSILTAEMTKHGGQTTALDPHHGSASASENTKKQSVQHLTLLASVYANLNGPENHSPIHHTFCNPCMPSPWSPC